MPVFGHSEFNTQPISHRIKKSSGGKKYEAFGTSCTGITTVLLDRV